MTARTDMTIKADADRILKLLEQQPGNITVEFQHDNHLVVLHLEDGSKEEIILPLDYYNLIYGTVSAHGVERAPSEFE
jgi:hypothetical protein